MSKHYLSTIYYHMNYFWDLPMWAKPKTEYKLIGGLGPTSPVLSGNDHHNNFVDNIAFPRKLLLMAIDNYLPQLICFCGGFLCFSDNLRPLRKSLFLVDEEPLREATHYMQLVGSLVYLTNTQPDISYALHISQCHHSHNPLVSKGHLV